MNKIYLPKYVSDYCIVAEPTDHYCNFKCYQTVGVSSGGNAYLYMIEVGNSSEGFSENIEDCEPSLTAVIKWDGCSHLCYDLYHADGLDFDSKNDAIEFCKLLMKLYDISEELITNWDKSNEGEFQ